MKATEAKLLQILSSVSQFIIPIYQRTDSWTPKECQQLWNDFLRAGSSDEIGVDFIGSVIHIDESIGEITGNSFIHIPSMTDLQNEDHQLVSLNAADHAIVPDAIAP
jgi:uncharacterized protein with ParB-like and HNH nuclease domain